MNQKLLLDLLQKKYNQIPLNISELATLKRFLEIECCDINETLAVQQFVLEQKS